MMLRWTRARASPSLSLPPSLYLYLSLPLYLPLAPSTSLPSSRSLSSLPSPLSPSPLQVAIEAPQETPTRRVARRHNPQTRRQRGGCVQVRGLPRRHNCAPQTGGPGSTSDLEPNLTWGPNLETLAANDFIDWQPRIRGGGRRPSVGAALPPAARATAHAPAAPAPCARAHLWRARQRRRCRPAVPPCRLPPAPPPHRRRTAAPPQLRQPEFRRRTHAEGRRRPPCRRCRRCRPCRLADVAVLPPAAACWPPPSGAAGAACCSITPHPPTHTHTGAAQQRE